MKLDTTIIEMEYEDLIDDGLTHNKAINSIAKDWVMSQEEVLNIINPYLKRLENIDFTGDLGEII
tara:strand:+ start:254 stop:448 length:195 start_codon:yes stop_codon:yes gene_type:complete